MPTTQTTYTYDELEAAVRGYLADVANYGVAADADARVKVIPGNSNFAAPDGIYGTLLLMSDIATGWPSVESGDDDDATRVDRRSTFSLQFYRPGAMSIMHKVTGLMQADFWIDRAAALGFRIGWNGSIRRVDAFIESFKSEFEERASVDLTIDYMQYSRVDSGRIEIVPMTTNSQPTTVRQSGGNENA